MHKNSKLNTLFTAAFFFLYWAPFLFACWLIAGCLHRGEKIEFEQGVVIRKKITPGYYDTYTTYDRVYDGRDYKGRRQYRNRSRTHSYYVQPVYTTTFQCQHQRVFDINRDDLYNSLNLYDTVTIEFYNLLDGDEHVKDYDFLTAYKQKRNGW